MASHQIVPVRLLSPGCNHHKRAKRSRQEWFRTPSPSFTKPVAKIATEHRMKHQHSTNIHNNCFHALDPLHSWISMYVCASPHKCAVTTNMRTHVHTCTYMHAHARTCAHMQPIELLQLVRGGLSFVVGAQDVPGTFLPPKGRRTARS